MFRLFGVELSPYSVKVRSYFRYKEIPHEWVPRSATTEAEFQQLAKLPLVPLVVAPDGTVLQDSTPILEHFEALYPEPSIHPSDPLARFASILLEEWGDEWANKWMFHLRWSRPADQDAAATEIAASMMGVSGEALTNAAAAIKSRMIGRVGFVGSNAQTGPQIESSYLDSIALLQRHLSTRSYLFGERPAFGDFGVAAELYECSLDPTPGGWLRERAPAVMAYVDRMQRPVARGDFEPWATLAPTLEPLLARDVAASFLPWSDANARAIASSQAEFTVSLAGGVWTQKPQKYHARSLAALRAKYAAAMEPGLDAMLERTGCRRWLVP